MICSDMSATLRFRKLLTLGAVAWSQAACPPPEDDEPPTDTGAPLDLVEELRAVDGVTVLQSVREGDSLRILMEVEQPQFWDVPASPTFSQRVFLTWRPTDRAVVMKTNGYMLRTGEPALVDWLDASMVSVEHRYFGGSVPEEGPDGLDWDGLTVRDAADDLHHVFELLQPVLQGPWVSTGGSKSGATALFHHWRHPDDMAAVVPVVAPLMFAADDERFLTVLDEVGTDGCRTRIRDMQAELLRHREALVEAVSVRDDLGVSADRAVEGTITDFEFQFWQYRSTSWVDRQCEDIPAPPYDDDKALEVYDDFMWRWLDQYTEDDILAFRPFFWQAAIELGYPALDQTHLDGLLVYGDDDLTEPFVPLPPPPFDGSTMQAVSDWLWTDAERVAWIYGDWDPWTAARVDVPDDADLVVYDVPEGDHLVGLGSLTVAEQADLAERLSRWTGLQVTPPAHDPTARRAEGPSLQEREGMRPPPR